ncbi:MAG: pseudouridine synthase [Chloroflexi bacterium OLB15]|nr:MAG: pseudouridine synthase [Chloroflexi bacterium OLB15]
MATANVGSRRASEQLIEQGRVRVNGQVITLGDKADPDIDVIEVDGQRLRFDKLVKRYIAIYKPKNVVSTSEPHENDTRKTIFDLVPASEHMFSIGRLDADSEGLMVLTNDGDLANRLTHPSYRHTKTYLVTVQGVPSTQTLDRWQRGIELTEDDGRNVRTAPCVVHMVKKSGSVSVLRVIMTEGKKRQIRRVANALGHPVGKLVRTDIGKLSIEGLKPGEYRDLDEEEIEQLSTPSPEFKVSRRPAPRHRTDRSEDARVVPLASVQNAASSRALREIARAASQRIARRVIPNRKAVVQAVVSPALAALHDKKPAIMTKKNKSPQGRLL